MQEIENVTTRMTHCLYLMTNLNLSAIQRVCVCARARACVRTFNKNKIFSCNLIYICIFSNRKKSHPTFLQQLYSEKCRNERKRY